jgi:hypothetical protein
VRSHETGSFATRAPVSSARRFAILSALALALLCALSSIARADTPPTLTIEPASNISIASAKLTGTVNPEGGPSTTFWHFEYSAKPEGEEAWVQFDGGGSFEGAEAEKKEALSVESIPTGLRAEQTYLVRLVADNGEFSNHVTTEAPYPSFTTDPATAPALSLEPAKTEVAYTTAHIFGSVDPEGGNKDEATGTIPIFWELQISKEPIAEGWQLAKADTIEGGAAEGNSPIEVKADLSGLQTDTKYFFRLVASYAGHEATPAEGGEFETEAVTPPTVSIEAPNAITATSAHLAGHLNPNGTDPTFDTAWHFECTPKCPGLGGGTIAADEASHEVAANAVGLQPNTTYHVQLVAKNVGGTSSTTAPGEAFTTEAIAPSVEATGASHVKGDSAQINARLNPNNLPSTYYFEWGTQDCASSPCTAIPASKDADAGEGGAELTLSEELSGLSTATTYYYRLVAQNAQGTSTTDTQAFTTAPTAAGCPNEVLRSGASSILPDCRAYEMVSPLDKNGGDIAAAPTKSRTSPDGNAVVYASRAAFAGTPGNDDKGSEYISRRLNDDWITYPITPQHETLPIPSIFSGSAYTSIFSPDLSRGVFASNSRILGVTSENVANVANLYLGTQLGSSKPEMRLISDSAQPVPSDQEGFNTGYVPAIEFADATPDFSHIIFESSNDLTSSATGMDRKVYEWTNGSLRLVGILPNSACGTPPCFPSSAVAGAGATFIPGSSSLNVNGAYTNPNGVISDDGERIFFTADPADPTDTSSRPGGVDRGLLGDLYMQEGTASTRIDASETNPPNPSPAGWSEFQWATPDGEKVFFISTRRLVDEDNDGEGNDLYEYDVGASGGHRLTLLTPESSVPGGLVVNHVVGVSTDGEFVYFSGEEAFDHLYVIHNDVIRTVAQRGATEPDLWGENGIIDGGSQARVTPDGRHALFMSATDQGLGYDNHGTNCPLDQGWEQLVRHAYEGRCYVLYLYSYASDTLTCVSCNPSGAPPKGNASFETRYAAVTFSTQNLSQPLSDDGRRVFFNSRDALVPGDTNGKIDVYEYDAESGKLALISSGECDCDSYFQAASPSGDDVFIVTVEQLVAIDKDNLYDLYDVRVNGGIAAQNAVLPLGCEGDACQPPANAPNDRTPASAGFSGPGDPVARKARPRKHRKHAQRKRHAKSKHQAKRTHGKRG